MSSLAPTDFESLVRESRPLLVRHLRRLVGESNAEDICQIALSNAARAWAGFRGDSSARTWLFHIATNAARDWIRAQPAWVLGNVESIDDSDTADVPDVGSMQDRELVRQQMSQCVDEFLRSLPEPYQTVLALSDCEELSDREIASIMGVTVGAAKIRLHRARALLSKN